MIPKIIHLIWFGKNEYPPLVQKCIHSWEKYLSDYEIMIWNEETFDIHTNRYVEQAYNAKKWAFVSDYVRLWALYNYGGIYMDTDVEVLKPLDMFLYNEAFSGFEAKDSVPTGIMGGVKNSEIFRYLLAYYDNRSFINEDGSYCITTNVVSITNLLLERGLKLNGRQQNIDGFILYPQIVFCPNNFSRVFNINSSKSYTIHHFCGSWTDHPIKNRTLLLNAKRYVVGLLRNIFGTKKVSYLLKELISK